MSTPNVSRLDGLFQIMSEELVSGDKVGSQEFAIQRQLLRMRKRAVYIKPELEIEGLAKFITINESLLSTEIQLDDDIVRNAQYFTTVMFERYNTRLDELNIQETLDWSHLYDLWKFGPGASNGIKGTHTVDKISQKMTCTASCVPLVHKLRVDNHYFRAFDALKGNDGVTLINGSKMTTVPKNESSVRIIAIEPSGNMAMQLAAGQYITNVLRSIGLDITKQQPLNKGLALRGSVSNSLATIDLKSASDMFTPELIRLLMPPKWYELLMQIRSPSTVINGKDVQLNMISTMGNGFTFPLMTFCLVALIYAMRCRNGGPNLFIDWDNTAVFGDDIIIPVSEYDQYCLLLQQSGLVVNHDKSYTDGPFRESCGGDYWKGEDVTPFYVKSLTEDAEVFVAINQLLAWSAKVKFPLWRSYAFLVGLLRKVHFIPEWCNTNQGILSSQVTGRYTFLELVRHEVELKRKDDEHFLMPLAIGGYVESNGSHNVYMPRQYNTRYRVRKGRIPKGFLSSHCPISRTSADSAFIDFIIALASTV